MPLHQSHEHRRSAGALLTCASRCSKAAGGEPPPATREFEEALIEMYMAEVFMWQVDALTEPPGRRGEPATPHRSATPSCTRSRRGMATLYMLTPLTAGADLPNCSASWYRPLVRNDFEEFEA
jgi:hypothetical protein